MYGEKRKQYLLAERVRERNVRSFVRCGVGGFGI